jgi:hypothetical protein
MAARYAAAYPSAMKCLTTDREGLTAYLRFAAGLRPERAAGLGGR